MGTKTPLNIEAQQRRSAAAAAPPADTRPTLSLFCRISRKKVERAKSMTRKRGYAGG
jgi:hypothetical protein